MAGSRLDRIGTIFSRTSGLIKAGGIKYQDRPIWFDVYRVFPPKYEPHISREPEKTQVQEILYREDKYRALFFKELGRNPGGIPRKLNDRNFQEPCQSFVKICLELIKTNPGWDDDEVYNAAVYNYKEQNLHLGHKKYVNDTPSEDIGREIGAPKHKTPQTISLQSLRELFKEAKAKQTSNVTERGGEDPSKIKKSEPET